MSRPARRRDDRPKCEHCREPIRWAYVVEKRGTKAALDPKPMPLDYEPDPRGLRTLYLEPPSPRWPQGRFRTGELRRGAQADAYRASGQQTYQQHYKTCAKKHEWGKPGKPYGSRQVTK